MRKLSGGSPPRAGVPHPLVAHGADASFDLRRVRDPAKRRGDHVAVLEGAGKFLALVGIVPQPMQQLGESPLGGIHASAPLDGLQFLAICQFGDLGGFLLCAVIAPQVVVVERSHIRSDWNHAGARGVECDGLNLIAGNPGFLQCLAGGGGQRTHVIVVRLRGVVRIFALAMQRIFGDRRNRSGRDSLSTRETRTLSVPKSTPATMAIRFTLVCCRHLGHRHTNEAPKNQRHERFLKYSNRLLENKTVENSVLFVNRLLLELREESPALQHRVRRSLHANHITASVPEDDCCHTGALLAARIVPRSLAPSPGSTRNHSTALPIWLLPGPVAGEPIPRSIRQQSQLLLNLDDDGLLKPFRQRQGMPAPGPDLGGWYDNSSDFNRENNFHGFIPGHSFGQYLSGMARAYAVTGSKPTQEKVDRLVRAFGETVEPTGKFYVDYRLPGYTFDKTCCGLIDAHEFAADLCCA